MDFKNKKIISWVLIVNILFLGSYTQSKNSCSYPDIAKKAFINTNKFRSNPNKIFLNLLKKNNISIKGVPKLKAVPAVLWSDELAQIAQQHSKDMADLDVLSHDGFAERYQKLMDYAKSIGSFASSIAENVADFNNMPDMGNLVVNEWILDRGYPMNQAGHRDNLLSTNKYCGIGICKNSKGTYYFTQIFANY
ncbi:MAG: CAP domain-containing protein [Candidatus Babeliales bacterium]|nr:CAP domain-containing protein [Candidatus Babeliales bacterium]